MKRFLKDLTYEEILLLVKNNPAFADKVGERTESDFWYWVNDEYFRGICFNYTAGSYYGHSFDFRGTRDTDIADHLKELQKNYCFFSEEEYNEVVSRFIELAERYDQIYCDLSDDDDERLGSRVAELREQVEKIISRILDAYYEYRISEEGLAEYVYEVCDDFDDYYMEDGGHQVYREVHYIEEIA